MDVLEWHFPATNGERKRMTPQEQRERMYSDDDIAELLEKAQVMGLDLNKGSELEGLQIGELERLVTVVQ